MRLPGLCPPFLHQHEASGGKYLPPLPEKRSNVGKTVYDGDTLAEHDTTSMFWRVIGLLARKWPARDRLSTQRFLTHVSQG